MSISPKGENQEDMGLNGIYHKLRLLDAQFLTQHRVPWQSRTRLPDWLPEREHPWQLPYNLRSTQFSSNRV